MASPTLTIPGKFLRQLATKQGVVCFLSEAHHTSYQSDAEKGPD